jgi:hypothetical protein
VAAHPSLSSQRQRRRKADGTHRRKALRIWKAAALARRVWKGSSVPRKGGRREPSPGSGATGSVSARIVRPAQCLESSAWVYSPISLRMGRPSERGARTNRRTQLGGAAPTVPPLEVGDAFGLVGASVEELLTTTARGCGTSVVRDCHGGRGSESLAIERCGIVGVLVTTSRLQRLVRGILHDSGSAAPSGV